MRKTQHSARSLTLRMRSAASSLSVPLASGGACGTAETTATIVASEAVGGECMGSTFGSIAVSCCWLGVSFNLIKG